MEDLLFRDLVTPAANSVSENTASNVASVQTSNNNRARCVENFKSDFTSKCIAKKLSSSDSGIEAGNDSTDGTSFARSERSRIANARLEQQRRAACSSWSTNRYNDTTPKFNYQRKPQSPKVNDDIDKPSSSMSVDVEAAAAAPSKPQIGGAVSTTGTCGALVPYSDVATSDPKQILKFRLPYQSYTWTPYKNDTPACERTHRHGKHSSTCIRFGHAISGYNSMRRLIRISASTPKHVNERRLRVAAASNNIEQIQRLLDAGVEVNSWDEQLRTPLHLAAGRGYTEAVRLLLKHGANPSLQDCIGNTPLHLAAVTSKIPVVILLLMAGTDPLCADIHGYNPLQLAETKLRLLQNCKGGDMLRIKSEVHEVVNLLVSYLRKREGFAQEVDALSNFCSRLTLSNAANEVNDEVRDLLSNIDSLSLKS